MAIKEENTIEPTMPVPDTLVVHAGAFHADDALTAALLERLNPDLKIERVRDASGREDEPGTLVADIGGGRFDHHQADAALREDGRKHAAVGLVYEAFPQLRPENEQAAAWLERRISDVEDIDNGVDPKWGHDDLSTLVSSSNPNWDESVPFDDRFREVSAQLLETVVDGAHAIPRDAPASEASKALESLDVRIAEAAEARDAIRVQSVERAHDLVQSAVDASDGTIVQLDRFIPWQEVVCESDASFVTYPSVRGGYNLQGVPTEPGSRELRQPMPREWLQEKPEGCSFVHQGRFIAAFDTEEHALAAGREAVAQRSARRLPDERLSGVGREASIDGPSMPGRG